MSEQQASDLLYEHAAICAEIAVSLYAFQNLTERQKDFRDKNGKRLFDTPIDRSNRARDYADQSLEAWGEAYHREYFFEKWGDQEALEELRNKHKQ